MVNQPLPLYSTSLITTGRIVLQLLRLTTMSTSYANLRGSDSNASVIAHQCSLIFSAKIEPCQRWKVTPLVRKEMNKDIAVGLPNQVAKASMKGYDVSSLFGLVNHASGGSGIDMLYNKK